MARASAIDTEFIAVDRDRFPAWIQGDGPPILFVHGAPGDWRTFAAHAAILADRYRCITFTQRWFGAAEWRADGPPFGTTEHAADLVAVAHALGLGPVALVSWSYGAHGALKATLDRPDLFSAHIAYEPGFATFVHDPAERAAQKADSSLAWGPVFAAREQGGDIVLAMFDASAGEGGFDALPAADQARVRDGGPALARLLEQTPPINLRCEDLAGMRVPTVIGYGDRSRPCFTIPSRAAATCMGCEQFVIEGADHMWPEQAPEDFASAIDRWLRRLSPAA